MRKNAKNPELLDHVWVSPHSERGDRLVRLSLSFPYDLTDGPTYRAMEAMKWVEMNNGKNAAFRREYDMTFPVDLHGNRFTTDDPELLKQANAIYVAIRSDHPLHIRLPSGLVIPNVQYIEHMKWENDPPNLPHQILTTSGECTLIVHHRSLPNGGTNG